MRAIEQGGVESFVAAKQHTPSTRLGFELFPAHADQIPCPCIPRFERFVPPRMRQRDHPTQSPPPLRRFHQHQHPIRPHKRILPPVSGGRRIRADRQKRPDDRPDSRFSGRFVEAGHAADAIPIGRGEKRVIEIHCGLDEVFRVAAAFEEREGAPRAQLDVVSGGRHTLFSSYFRHRSIVYLAYPKSFREDRRTLRSLSDPWGEANSTCPPYAIRNGRLLIFDPTPHPSLDARLERKRCFVSPDPPLIASRPR